MAVILDRNKDLGPYVPQPGDDVIICRCEEITRGEIRKAIHEGLFTMNEIKRFLRAGMGLCQGKTCGRQVKSILAKELGMSPAEIEECTPRSPNRPAEMQVIGNEVDLHE